MHLSSCNHTKIIIKVQSNQYLELQEVYLNERLTTRSPQMTGRLKMVRGTETQNGPLPQPCVVIKNWENYLACRATSSS